MTNLVFTVAGICVALISAPGGALRYEMKPGDQFAYEIKITVEDPDETTTYQGVTRYTVDAVQDDQLKLTYRGGLNESKKIKPSRSRGRPFGPGFGPFGPMRRPSFPSPFSRPTFAGKTQTTNKITIGLRGNVLAMEGDSHLPYLLGNVSLLPFELLPERNERRWSSESGATITEESESQGPPFGPFSRFGRDPKSTQSASEVSRYSIVKQNASEVEIAKQYELITPKTDDQPGFEMKGQGTWVFDVVRHVPKSYSAKLDLDIIQDQSRVTLPITITYRLMSDEEIAKLDAEAQRKREEMQRAAEEARRKAEAPLTPEEKQTALTTLASGDTTKMLETLGKLKAKKPKDPDAEVVQALHGLLGHVNKRIREDAQRALMNWSPEYKQKVEINKAYQGPSPVKSTGRQVTPSTPLFVGQVVQARQHGTFWFPAEILELLSDGRVMVRMRGGMRNDVVLQRTQIQLAPELVDQPKRPESLSTSPSALRVWEDASGMFSVKASLIGITDGAVKLKREDGREITVPLDKLSEKDRQFVLEQQKAVVNPFE